MSISIFIRNFLGLDKIDDYLWLNSITLSDLKTEKVIENTVILRGENLCDLTLMQGSNIHIEDKFIGRISGLGNNVVRIQGHFRGQISCQKLIVLSGSNVEGEISIQSLVVQKGSTFKTL